MRATTLGTGDFFCPLEGGDRTYRRREVRQWYAPFAIPVLPRHRLGDYIECEACGSSFTEEVLRIVTTGEIERRLEWAARALIGWVAVCRFDEAVRMVALREARTFMGELGDPEAFFPRPPVGRGIPQLVDALRPAADVLDDLGRRRLLASAVRTAAASGTFTAQHLVLIETAGLALELSAVSVRSLILSAGMDL